MSFEGRWRIVDMRRGIRTPSTSSTPRSSNSRQITVGAAILTGIKAKLIDALEAG